eukprot:3101645-Pleurochrysis_carterae.AAC.1
MSSAFRRPRSTTSVTPCEVVSILSFLLLPRQKCLLLPRQLLSRKPDLLSSVAAHIRASSVFPEHRAAGIERYLPPVGSRVHASRRSCHDGRPRTGRLCGFAPRSPESVTMRSTPGARLHHTHSARSADFKKSRRTRLSRNALRTD